MTGDEMKTAFQGMVDDNMNETLMYQLFNLAKAQIEAERPWQILQDVDTSQSIAAGHTYLTPITLPTRFLTPTGVFVGDSRIMYQQIPFIQRERYKDIVFRWYLKMKDNKYFICGTPAAGQTIYFFYVGSSPDIDESETWTFPGWSHLLIPITAAKLFYNVDRIEKIKSFRPEWAAEERTIRLMLTQWDNRLVKKTAMTSRHPFDPSTHPNIAF